MGGTEWGEVVAITGASAGVGRATALEFGRHGARIGLIARGGAGMDGLESARREVEALGGQAVVLAADVSDAAQVEAAAAKLEETFGPIDVWVNDAMVTVFAPFTDLSPEEYRRVTEVTYLGQVYGTMAALKRMKPRDHGNIVLVGSALAYRGIPLQSAYCGSKHAIQGMMDSVRAELIHDGSQVRLSMVQMPALNTPQFGWCLNKMEHKSQPVPPIFQPEVAARAIYYAAHANRRELYVGLFTSIVITANKWVPGFGDWYLGKTGYQSQQYGAAPEASKQNNLWEPVAGDHGAHGTFDDKAHERSWQFWLDRRANVAALAGAGLAATAVLGMALGVVRGKASGTRQGGRA
jgi:NAD(P)-dependent dehydrogenase (short-subunit alcohol dehydrogenase family)